MPGMVRGLGARPTARDALRCGSLPELRVPLLFGRPLPALSQIEQQRRARGVALKLDGLLEMCPTDAAFNAAAVAWQEIAILSPAEREMVPRYMTDAGVEQAWRIPGMRWVPGTADTVREATEGATARELMLPEATGAVRCFRCRITEAPGTSRGPLGPRRPRYEQRTFFLTQGGDAFVRVRRGGGAVGERPGQCVLRVRVADGEDLVDSGGSQLRDILTRSRCDGEATAMGGVAGGDEDLGWTGLSRPHPGTGLRLPPRFGGHAEYYRVLGPGVLCGMLVCGGDSSTRAVPRLLGYALLVERVPTALEVGLSGTGWREDLGADPWA